MRESLESHRVMAGVLLGAAIVTLIAGLLVWNDARDRDDDVSLAVKDGKHLFTTVRFKGLVGYSLGPWPDAPDVETACKEAAALLQTRGDAKIVDGSLPPLLERKLEIGDVKADCEWSVGPPPLAGDAEFKTLFGATRKDGDHG